MLRIEIARGTETTITALNVCYGKRQTEWRLYTTFDRTRVHEPKKIFSVINSYLATLDDSIQKEIFDIYEDLNDIIPHSCVDANVLLATVRTSITRLIQLLDLDRLDHHCKFKGGFAYPKDLLDQYTPNEPRESTYIKADYHGLLYIATLLKAVLPIWGELIRTVQKEVGSTHKEYVCVAILGESEFFNRPEMVRLTEYIHVLASKVTVPATAVFNNIGTEQLPDWLVGQVLIRRLAMSETNTHAVNLISNIYNFITTTTEKLDGQFGSRIRDKRRPREMGNEEDVISVAENYKVKQNVAINSIITYEVYLKDPEKVAEAILSDVNMELVRACVSHLRACDNLEISEWRLQLAGLITGKVIPSKSLQCLPRLMLLNVLGIAQAILFQLGFDDVAHFLTATERKVPADTLRGDGYSGGHRSRITPENIEKLMETYRFFKVVSKLQLEKDQRQANPGYIFIEYINKITQASDWLLNSPVCKLDDTQRNGRRYLISRDIKNQLAELIIAVKGKEGVLNAY